MAALSFFLLFVFCLHSSLLLSSDAGKTNALKEDTCEAGPWLPNTTIAVKISKKVDGKWKTSFYAHKRMRNPSRVLDLNLKHEVISCGDTKYMALSGKLKDTDVDKMLEDSGKEAASDVEPQREGDARRTETTAVDTTLINSTLQEVKKSSDRMKSLEDRQTILENTIAKIDGNMTLVRQSLTSLENILKTMNEKLKIVEEKQTSIENMLNVMNDTNNNLEVVGKIVKKLEAMENSMNKVVDTPNNWVVRQFDATLKGKNIALSKDFKSATRFVGKDVPGTAGVISNSMLKEDEVFEIIIEETINKYTDYGIAIGVINAKSDEIKETSIFSRITGTWSIFSRSDSEKGKSIAYREKKRIDENYPLDTRNMKVGSVLGVSRRRNGDLHFYLDGVDCGPAFKDVPKDVYAFVDVMNYVTKIRIYS